MRKLGAAGLVRPDQSVEGRGKDEADHRRERCRRRRLEALWEDAERAAVLHPRCQPVRGLLRHQQVPVRLLR